MMQRLESLAERITPTLFLLLAVGGALVVATPRAGLGLSFPTGELDDFHGTGDTRGQPTLILSRVFADRFQPLLNSGIDLNVDRVERDVVRWALGPTAQVWGVAHGRAVLLGLHELKRERGL